MKKIYLACPYSHDNKLVRKARFRAVSQKAAELMQEGYIVFSPLSHSCPIADHIDNHVDHDFWMKQDLTYISDWCEELWVYCVDGDSWSKSRGVCREIEFATLHKKKVRFISP